MLFFSLRANIENNSAMIIFVHSKDWAYPHINTSPVFGDFQRMLYSWPSGEILDCALIILKSCMLDWRNLPHENQFICRKKICRFFHSKVNRNLEKIWEVNKTVMVSSSIRSERLESVMPYNWVVKWVYICEQNACPLGEEVGKFLYKKFFNISHNRDFMEFCKTFNIIKQG